MANNIKSILAVDDAYTNLEILNGLLKDSFNMHLAKSGKTALTALERMTPDLILLDIEMPDMSGFEVMEAISREARLKKIPVIFVTAHASKDFVIEAGRQGAKDYLVKPFGPDLLYAKINKAMHGGKPGGSGIRTSLNTNAPPGGYDLEHDIKIALQASKKKKHGIQMKVIGDLLDHADSEPGKDPLIPTYFDLYKFFAGIESFNRLMAEAKGLVFESGFDNSLPDIIFGEEIRLNQILVSILDNVIQRSDSGYIRFSVELLTDEDETESVAFTIEGSELGIIANDFMGIYSKLEQITKKSGSGARPRLPVARRLGEIIGGEIYFVNARDRGAAFAIELPLRGDEASRAAKRDMLKPVTVRPEVKVLVVDDNPVNLKIASAMLLKHGAAAMTAMNAEEAVAMVQRERFDLVFMDHLMPGKDGAEAARDIRALGGEFSSEPPIIALSAYNAAKARELFLRSGMNDFITKPIDDAELNMTLKNWLPPDKIADSAPGMGQYEKADNARVNKLLDRIRLACGHELSIINGLKNVGGDKKLYVEVIKRFHDWIENDMRLISEAALHRRWRDYTIRVHALKTVFANIGDELMSDWAASLEKAATDGDYEKCVKETEQFNTNAMRLHAKLAGVFANERPAPREKKNAVPPDKLNECLLRLGEACVTCFAGRAKELAAELEGSSFDEEIDRDISQIRDYIDQYEFDKAYGVCQALLRQNAEAQYAPLL